MELVVVNGSPRKQWNTAQLLAKVIEGAQIAGMDTKLVHLYSLDYKGCTSCYACKQIGGASYGRCAMRDGLTPLLDADALVLGTPTYFANATGMTRCFIERVAFPYITFTNPPETLAPRRYRTAVLYTMGISEDGMSELLPFMEQIRQFMEMTFGTCELMTVNDTLHFDDYSAYTSSLFDSDAKMKHHREVFPHDLARAYELGRRMAESFIS